MYELARVMGTSVRMIELHYGALLDGAHAAIADRLDALEAVMEAAEAGPTSKAEEDIELFTARSGLASPTLRTGVRRAGSTR